MPHLADNEPSVNVNVYSVTSGTVKSAGWAGSAGNMVAIETNSYDPLQKSRKLWIRFLHMKDESIPREISVGAAVTTSSLLGIVGNTGFDKKTQKKTSDYAHLHVDVNNIGSADGSEGNFYKWVNTAPSITLQSFKEYFYISEIEFDQLVQKYGLQNIYWG